MAFIASVFTNQNESRSWPMDLSLEQIKSFLPLLLILAFLAWRSGSFKKVKGLLPELISQGGVIVDVRGAEEFRDGANPKSILILLCKVIERIRDNRDAKG